MNAIKKFMNGYDNLEKALEMYFPPSNNFELIGLIEYFKITYDLAWKALRELLIQKGFGADEIQTAKQTFEKAKILGLIREEEPYIDILKLRNESEYIYDEDVARVMVKRIKRNYVPYLRDLNKVIRTEKK